MVVGDDTLIAVIKILMKLSTYQLDRGCRGGVNIGPQRIERSQSLRPFTENDVPFSVNNALEIPSLANSF